jgi:Cu(I)/Ag(I) efflux system membrane protein CusA/SilA
MAIAALLAVTLDPAVRMMFARFDPIVFRARWLGWLSRLASGGAVGTYYPEEKHPVSVLMHRIYERPCRFMLRHAKAAIAVSALLVLATVPIYFKLGSEFMPPLNEGTILYMPSTLPGLGLTEATRILQVQDRLIR